MAGRHRRPITDRLRLQLFIRQFGLCYWCETPMSLMLRHRRGNMNVYATLDHVTKKEHGGRLVISNLVLAHGRCNASRHQNPEDFKKRIARMQKQALMLAHELEFYALEPIFYERLWQ